MRVLSAAGLAEPLVPGGAMQSLPSLTERSSQSFLDVEIRVLYGPYYIFFFRVRIS